MGQGGFGLHHENDGTLWPTRQESVLGSRRIRLREGREPPIKALRIVLLMLHARSSVSGTHVGKDKRKACLQLTSQPAVLEATSGSPTTWSMRLNVWSTAADWATGNEFDGKAEDRRFIHHIPCYNPLSSYSEEPHGPAIPRDSQSRHELRYSRDGGIYPLHHVDGRDW